jgi:hypothetical protein
MSGTAKKILCARYLYDGCKTLDEMVKVLREEIEKLQDLKADGWKLAATVANDKGVLVNTWISEEDGDVDDPWWHVIDDSHFDAKK